VTFRLKPKLKLSFNAKSKPKRVAVPGEEDVNAVSDPYAKREIEKGEPIMNVTSARQWEPPWTPLHAALLGEPAFTTLSHSALRVLLFLLGSRKRDNHTELTVQLADMQRVYGWSEHSPNSLRKALDTLLRRKLIYLTSERRGSATATYAISWLVRRGDTGDE
jgi:hypothetical protein